MNKLLRDAARQRRQEANTLRRQQAKALAQSKSRSPLSANFAVSLDRFIRGEQVDAELKGCVAQLILETKVTVENIQATQKRPALRWRDYLNPMYNTLRYFVSKSKGQGDIEEGDGPRQKFWLAVSAELQSQLDQLASAAGVSSEALGRASCIIEDELDQG